MSLGTNLTTPAIRHQNPPDIDEFEFGMSKRQSKWRKIRDIMEVLYDVNLGCAIALGLISLLLFLTILNPKLRSHSPIWYFYHLNAMSVLTSLVFHTMIQSGIVLKDKGICYFVMYSIEYILFILGFNILLLNAEIYFTKILPVQKWQWNPFLRFIITILATWNIISVLTVYVVVNNNDARNFPTGCLYFLDDKIVKLRLILRSVVPALILAVFTLVLIGTHCLKRSRIRITSASGGLREVQTVTHDGEMQWTCLAVFSNLIFITRTVLVLIIVYGDLLSDVDNYVPYMVLVMAYSQCVYLLPLGLFFVADGRAVVKALICKAIGLISCGRVRFGEDLEQLAVSFGQEAGACVH